MNRKDLLTLPQFHKEINTCIDDNLDMICEKLERCYSLSFYDIWDFKFNESENEVSKKIYLSNEINYKNIQRFIGIKLEDYQFCVWKDTLSEIRKSLFENNPIMIHMYRRLFPWDVNYLKENVPDFFTHKAMAIDIDNNNILFTDGFCNKYNENLSIKQCEICSTNRLTKIIIEDIKHIDFKSFFNEFKTNQLKKENMFKNIEKFIEVIEEQSIIKDLNNYKGELYKYSPMFNSLNKIIRSRKKVKQLLKDLGKTLNNQQILNLSNEFDNTILRWEYINSIFIKYSLTFNNRDLQKSVKYLSEILEIEKKLYEILERIDV